MIQVHWFRRMVKGRGEYAHQEDFVRVFERERAGLQRLALMLTANSEAAKQCLSRALRDCMSSSSVSKEWVLSWIRRVIIRNAISLITDPGGESVAKTSDGAGIRSVAFSQDDLLVANVGCNAILDLPECDRFVYVICVLQHYSINDCALLLNRPLRDVIEARLRVDEWRMQIGELTDIEQGFATISPA